MASITNPVDFVSVSLVGCDGRTSQSVQRRQSREAVGFDGRQPVPGEISARHKRQL